jgi:lipopolysaccharide transport system ATP-binding protein
MIAVDSLSKRFKLYRSPSDRLKEIITRKKYHTDFQALNGVSFSVAAGETLGIIGQNGAGKSTLLKILTGILLPDSGTVSIDGKITGLLELGTGFNPEMTGIENIFMNGALLGMSREEINGKKAAIIDFAELGEFIYEQIKTYSSGMVMRLAFAVAIHADPRCFVVDEALSVGDAHFQQKCMTKIREFRKNGGSIIFVSHDMNAVKILCDKAILLNQGTVLEEGSPENVVNSYNFFIAKMNDVENRITVSAIHEERSYGTYEASIRSVTIRGEDSRSSVISSGEAAVISIDIEPSRDIDDITVGIVIRDKYGQDIFGTNTYHHEAKTSVHGKMPCRVLFKMRMDIGPGKYSVTAALHSRDTHLDACFHWADNIASFEIAGNYDKQYVGLCKLYPEISMIEET